MNKEEEEEIIKDLKKVKNISSLAESEGGKELIKSLSEDIISSIEDLISRRMTLDLQGYTSLACDIKTRLDLLKVLKKAKKNEKYLEEILNEAMAK